MRVLFKFLLDSYTARLTTSSGSTTIMIEGFQLQNFVSSRVELLNARIVIACVKGCVI